MDNRAAARLLGGEPLGRHDVLCPGPQHGPADRSLHVTLTGGVEFRVHSYSGDDWAACRDHVKARLGLSRDMSARSRSVDRAPRPAGPDPDDAERTRRALALWDAARVPRGTIVEHYLASRGLELPEEAAGAAIRFLSDCPWREDGETLRVPALVALFRDVLTDEPRAIHRTRLAPEGRKLGRMMLGPVGGAAIKIDEDAAVTMGLTIGEGAETALAARQLGLRPVWALGSAGAIGAFPVLPGVEALTILEEHDAGANAKAIEACASRWRAAGREVLIVSPLRGGDVNDALMTRSAC